MLGVADWSVTASISSVSDPRAVESLARDSTYSTGLVHALRENLLTESEGAWGDANEVACLRDER